MILVRILLALLAPSIVGGLLLKNIFIHRRLPFVVFAAFSFGLGQGVLAQSLFLWGVLGGSFDALTIYIILLVLGGLFYLGLYLRRFSPVSQDEELPSLPQTIGGRLFRWYAVAVLTIYMVTLFWQAWYWPVWGWDSLATAIFNAKVFFYERSLRSWPYLPHASFPLQVPFSVLWLNLNLGQWHDEYIKILFPIIFLAFVVIQHYFLKRRTNSLWAYLGLLLFLSSSLLITHAASAYRDVFLLYYTGGTLISLLLWQDTRQEAWLVLGGVLAGFGIFTKLEGQPYFLIYVLLLGLCCFKQKKNFKATVMAGIKFISPGVGIYLLFYMSKIVHGIILNESVHWQAGGFFIERLGWILQRFSEDLFWRSSWNIVWFLCVLTILLNRTAVQQCFSIQFLLLALVLFLSVPFSISLITSDATHILSEYTLSRLFLHFFPIPVWLIVLIFHRAISGNLKERRL